MFVCKKKKNAALLDRMHLLSVLLWIRLPACCSPWRVTHFFSLLQLKRCRNNWSSQLWVPPRILGPELVTVFIFGPCTLLAFCVLGALGSNNSLPVNFSRWLKERAQYFKSAGPFQLPRKLSAECIVLSHRF